MTRTRVRILVVVACAVALGSVAVAPAITTPGRTLPAPGVVRDLALTGTSIAYVADVPGSCRKNVHLWSTASRGTWTFPGRVLCEGGPSTGAGIADIGVATRRLVWLTYAGGNIRDWMLYTATPTSKAPKQIRFVSRPVEDPSPIVIGEGSVMGVPYAVDDKVVYLGDTGARIFSWDAPAPVTALAAGVGPGSARVAAAQAFGSVTLLSQSGEVVATVAFASAPTTIRLAPAGLVAQVDGFVRIVKGGSTKVVALPSGATMLDYANGRILYSRGARVRTITVSTGVDRLLIGPTGTKPPPIGLDTSGLAWSVGKRVNWACAVCIDFDG